MRKDIVIKCITSVHELRYEFEVTNTVCRQIQNTVLTESGQEILIDFLIFPVHHVTNMQSAYHNFLSESMNVANVL